MGKKPGDWYPQMGHKLGEADWRLAHGEPIVCTDPLTWASNGLGDPDLKPAEWRGMLNVLKGGSIANDDVAPEDMDTCLGLMYTPHAGLRLKKMVRMTPEEFASHFEDGTTIFECTVNMKSGDLQLVPLPVELGGSETASYEHMNFYMFWFNIRDNV